MIDDQLRELGSQLPWDRPDAARRDAVRSALLVAAAEQRTRPSLRWYVIGGVFAAGALAAAAVLLLVLRAPQVQPQSVARIETSAAADVDRNITRTATGLDEVVRVRDGTVNVAVGALRAGDHVRVATRDAEVEGEGRYEVVVNADQLSEVKVHDGRVTIRITGQQSVFLTSKQTWRPTIAKADVVTVAPVGDVKPPHVDARTEAPRHVEPDRSAPTRAVTAPPPTPTRPVTTPAPPVTAPNHSADAPRDSAVPATPADPTQEASRVVVAEPAPMAGKQLEKRFQAGMQLLKAGKAAEAARVLGAAADEGADDPLAADARYFQAVALTKAGRKTEAERALVAFLDHAPRSLRRGRAAVMLARLIAERGDTTSARAWFESALADPDASVVAAARAGIAALR